MGLCLLRQEMAPQVQNSQKKQPKQSWFNITCEMWRDICSQISHL